jgi:hypothetical protein
MTPPFLGEQFDSCWDFVAAYLPGVDPLAYLCPDKFVQVRRPRDGDLVMTRHSNHCGIYWQGGLLHQPARVHGVVYEPGIGENKNFTYYRSTLHCSN